MRSGQHGVLAPPASQALSSHALAADLEFLGIVLEGRRRTRYQVTVRSMMNP